MFLLDMDSKYADLPDELWELIQFGFPAAEESKRRRATDRRSEGHGGIVYRLRTGCQWEPYPRVRQREHLLPPLQGVAPGRCLRDGTRTHAPVLRRQWASTGVDVAR